jgi:putative membrane protein
MRSTTLITAVALGLALAACGKKNEEAVNTTTTEINATSMSNESSMGAAGAALPAQQFADTIVGSDMFEIQSGKLAEAMGSTPAVKDFGKMLVTDHTKSSTMFKAAAKKTSPVVSLPMILPADLKSKMDALKAAKGADFDKLFVSQQTEGHQNALKAYSSGGDQASLKEFATTATPVVQGHLTKLEAMPR